MKKLYSVLLASAIFMGDFALCSDLSVESESTSIPSSNISIRQHQALLSSLLSDGQQREVHFFWTTGRTMSANPAYGANTHVEVGGSGYGHRFFDSVDAFLSMAPQTLKIKFVCDEMTHGSNASNIQDLQSKYGDRFSIRMIHDVVTHLKKTFTSPVHQKKLDVIFQNATAGHPVLASDVYRLIAMHHGQDQTVEGDNIPQYTYCDIDLFVRGLRTSDQETSSLLSALLQRPEEKDFVNALYVGRAKNNNDLIKMNIKKTQAYADFCAKILDGIETEKNIFTKFYDLHKYIRSYEDLETSNPSFVMGDFPYVMDRQFIQAVTAVTGPIFLDGFRENTTNTLTYPSLLDGSWYTGVQALNYSRDKAPMPSNIFNFGFGDDGEEVCHAFDTYCHDYHSALEEAFYAKRFGENHPFNRAVRQYLIDQYPYASQCFKDGMKENYAHHSRDIHKKYSFKRAKKSMEDIESTIKAGEVYFQQKEKTLVYKGKDNDDKLFQGEMAMQGNQALTFSYFRRNYSAIMSELSDNGVSAMPAKKGKTYETWRGDFLGHLTEQWYVGEPKYHYMILQGLLAQLGVYPTPVDAAFIDAVLSK